jgi:hypothetical protein
MILEKYEVDNYRFELVNEEDILETYKMRGVPSCMAGENYPNTQIRLKFYLYVPGLSILRLLDSKNQLKGRALVWYCKNKENQDLTVIDRIYTAPKTRLAATLFKENWKKFATVRKDTKQHLTIPLKLPKGYKSRHIYPPYLDTFRWISPAGTYLYNWEAPKARLWSHWFII